MNALHDAGHIQGFGSFNRAMLVSGATLSAGNSISMKYSDSPHLKEMCDMRNLCIDKQLRRHLHEQICIVRSEQTKARKELLCAGVARVKWRFNSL